MHPGPLRVSDATRGRATRGDRARGRRCGGTLRRRARRRASPAACATVVAARARTRPVVPRAGRRCPSSSATGCDDAAAPRSCGRRSRRRARRDRGSSASNSSSSRGRCGAQTLLGEEVRVARRDDAVDRRAVRRGGGRDGCDRYAATDRGRARRRAGLRRITAHTARARVETVVELAVDVAEEARPSVAPSDGGRGPLLVSRRDDERVRDRRRDPRCPSTPSVHTHRCTSVPASAHFASVAPQPNSMSSGCAPIASTRLGRREVERRSRRHGREARARARSSGTSTSKPSASSRTMRTLEADAPGFRARAARTSPAPYANANGAVDRERTAPACRRRGGRARATAIGGRAVAGDVVERRRERQVGVHDDDAGEALVAAPMRGRRRPRASSEPGSSSAREPVRARTSARPRARSTRPRWAAAPAAATTVSAMRCASATRASSSSAAARRRLAEPERPDRDDDARRRDESASGGGCIAWRAYATGRGCPLLRWRRALFYPALRYGLRWTIEGAERIPRAGPVILASNHVSYLDPLTLAYVADRAAPAPALPRQGRAVRQARRSARCCAARTRSRCSAARTNAVDALDAAVDALAPRRVRRGVPRGHDLARPRADGREVGHRAPRARERRRRSRRSGCGARTASCSRAASRTGGGASRRRPSSASRSRSSPTSTSRTRPIGSWTRSASASRGRARSTRSSRRPATTAWWARDAGDRRTLRSQSDRADVKVAVIGAGSWGTAVAALVAANAPTTLWARRAELADAHRRRRTRTPTTCPAIALPGRRCAPPSTSTRRARTPTSSCSACRRTGSAPCSPRRGRTSRRTRRSISLVEGRRAGHAAPHDRGRRRGARRPRPVAHRRADRTEPRQGGRGRPADGVGRRDRPTRPSPRSCSSCSSARRSASTRTPTSSAARSPAR